jgi:hypothetical protein
MVVRSCIKKAQKLLYTKNEKVQCAKNLYQPSMCFFLDDDCHENG